MNQWASADVDFESQNSEVDPVRSPKYGYYPKKKTILLSILAYSVIHCIIRLLTSPNYTLDEAQYVLLAQSFQFGYSADTSTLLVWLLHALDLTFGLNLVIVSIFKYTCLCCGLIAFYHAALIVFDWMDTQGYLRHRLDLAAAATGAWALIFITGWGMHEDKLPLVMDFLVLSCVLLSFTNALTRQGNIWWIVFGASCGLCLLGHIHLVIFPACLVASAMGMVSLTRPHYDASGEILSMPAISWFRVTLAFLIMLLLNITQIIWLLSPQGPVMTLSMENFGLTPDLFPVTQESVQQLTFDRLFNLQNLATDSVLFAMPLLVVFMLLFWPMWFAKIYPFFPKRDVEEGPFERTWRRLFSATLRLSILLTTILVFILGLDLDLPSLLPVLFTLPIWLFFQVQRSGPYFISMRAFAGVTAFAIALTPIGLFVDWSEDIMSCKDQHCHAYMPMQDFAKNLTLEGFAAGTIVGMEPHLTGNLRNHFPNARFVDAHYPLYAFPKTRGRNTCLIVWRDEPEMPAKLAIYVRDELAIDTMDTSPQGAIRKHLIRSLDKHSVLYYRFVQPNSNCR